MCLAELVYPRGAFSHLTVNVTAENLESCTNVLGCGKVQSLVGIMFKPPALHQSSNPCSAKDDIVCGMKRQKKHGSCRKSRESRRISQGSSYGYRIANSIARVHR